MVTTANDNQQDLTQTLTEKLKIVRNLEGITKAELCGTWIWVKFDGKPSDEIRTELKQNGFRWARKKKEWYFAGKPSLSRGGWSKEEIRDKYGSVAVV